jgi:yecA family protein
MMRNRASQKADWSLPPSRLSLQRMTLDEIRRELEQADGLPGEALTAAVGQAAALAPEVIALIDKAVEGVCLLPKQESLLFLGLHALAAAKETSAYRPLLTLLQQPEDELDSWLGDALTQNGPGLLLGLFDGDVEPIYAALENPDTYGTVNWILFQVLARLVWEGRAERAPFVDFIDRFDRDEIAPTDDFAWYGWQDAIMSLGLEQFRGRVQRGWEAGRTPNDRDIDREEWLAGLDRVVADPENQEFFRADRIEAITDPVASLGWLDRSSQPVTERSDRRDPAEAIALSESELDWLGRFLVSRQAPDTTLNLEAVDGFFAAALAGPESIMPSECMGMIWGPDGKGPIYDSREQMQFVTELLMCHWQTIAARLDARFPHEPVISSYKSEDSGAWWSLGFMLGMHLRRDAWTPLLEDKESDVLVNAIAALAAIEQETAEVTAEARAEIVDKLPVTLLAISSFWREGPLPPKRLTPVRSSKIGRNDPCPCGSGRKYKKCCGANAR